MRFSTRAFLSTFVPFAVLLTVSFWLIQNSVLTTVRNRLRSSLREVHETVARAQAKSALHESQFLRVMGENATLKAGLQLLAVEPESSEARLTLIDQLGEMAETHEIDVLLVGGADGRPIGGVVRSGSKWEPVGERNGKDDRPVPRQNGYATLRGQTFVLTSIPVSLGEESVGTITVGEAFRLSDYSTPMVLFRDGKPIQSSLPEAARAEVEAGLRTCGERKECELQLAGTSYLSIPLETAADGWVLRSFQDVDAVNGPVQEILKRVFGITGLAALFAALLVSAASSRSIVRPIAGLVRHLHTNESSYAMPAFQDRTSTIPEIRELITSFNRAAGAVEEGRDYLRRAYVGFISSLASALDARDRYTAGHSHRVSAMATATARFLGLPESEVESIRVGALLHDIGKIGVSDQILQKAGPLTTEEFDQIKQHPEIGKRILEPVRGFEEYLPIVELHHENWDGSGYPHGLRGEEVPVGARIVHVVDAYDAITTDRPYRPGMSHATAVGMLREFSGTQFDPAVVQAFLATGSGRENRSLESLIHAVANSASSPVAVEQPK